ncbi:MAG: alanine racemase, partial [Myxococcales bacterium]|nr:alanine racemase [Myxococcales bacterium]
HVRGERLVTDTRGGLRPGDVFVGLEGPHFDGNRFASYALEQGASVVITTADLQPRAGAAVVHVDRGLDALRSLAGAARRRLAGTVVAITGSNGKTLVKDLLATALAGRSVWASPMSWNSAVGVPLALVHADPTASIVLLECGVSEAGEMARHADIVRPDVGVFVNVGDAHIEGFGSRATIAHEKALLFASADRVFVPADQALAREALGDRAVPVPTHGEVLEVDRQLALAVAEALGADPAEARRALEGWRPPSMRLEISTTPRGVVLVNDAYTSDPESVVGALAVLQRERTPGRSWAVLGGLAEQGNNLMAATDRVARALVQHRIDGVVGIGPGGARLAEAARAHGVPTVEVLDDVEEASVRLAELVGPGDRVLLKGRRPDRLERLAAVFFDALAPAVLTVDLDQLVENVRAIQALVAPAELMPVVKASAYGIEPVRVALALQHAGVSHFAVAYPDEGVQLRRHGVVRPVLVQNVVPTEVEKLVAHGLSAQVSAVDQLDALSAEAERQKRSVRVHLKVDSGMGRAGCNPEDAPLLAERVRHDPWLVWDGLMTHFAAADDPASDAFTREQIATFDAVLAALPERPRWVHASNSAGIARFPEATYTMVRSGIALWGYSEAGGRVHTRPVLRLTTRVVSVKDVPAHHPVGYGRTWETGERSRRIAVVALGYADGYPWSLSNRGEMAIGGARCPVVGRVCMDVTMLDVTGVPDVHPGTEVVVYGPGPGEPDLVRCAALAGTIPYELLTRLSPRVRRVFESSL